MTKLGSWEGAGWYRYSPPTHPSHTPTPGTPLPRTPVPTMYNRGARDRLNMAVGLRSVGQLSLYNLFSGFQGMTEGYNLSGIGRINNHSHIPGFN